ncbi:MAG: preprotein translocase subunit SecE [Patescibacteria group bacterium]
MFSRIKSYIQESHLELGRVNWPSRQETTRLTLIVIGFSVVLAVFLGMLDILFNYLLINFVI